MIKLERNRTLAAVPSKYCGDTRIVQARRLLDLHLSGGLEDLDTKYWKQCKPQLRRESNEKCAYCEALTSVVAHGDVEHYRPQSRYWWLAYCYENYLYACQICNETYKRDNFPILGTPLTIQPPLPNPLPVGLSDEELQSIVKMFGPDPVDDAAGLPLTQFLDFHRAEIPLLPNPYWTDPEPFFSWVADPILKEVEIAPRDHDAMTLATFGAVEKYLGLNREELRRVRWRTYAAIATASAVLQTGGLPAAAEACAKEYLVTALTPDAPFAAMSRYFVHTEWKLDLG